jgi:hypothetical protein
MKQLVSALASLAFVVAAIGPVSAATSSLSLNLAAQNASGESGQASLSQVDGGVQVVISIPNAPAGPQPAHVHTGTCSNLGGVAYPLTSVVGGASTTVIKGVTIDQLLAGKFAINVHKSTSDLGTYVACADIVAPPVTP